MGMRFEKKGKDVHAYVGPDIEDGQEFDGDKMRDADGVKNYTHIKNGRVVRFPGVPGKRSPKW